MKESEKIILLLILLAVFDLSVWGLILFEKRGDGFKLYFLNVGQGDAEIVFLPPRAKILIDGGPNKKAVSELDSILSWSDRYIDLVVMSHPQIDHFAGLIEVIKRYEVGAFIWAGKENKTDAFGDLKKAIQEKNVPTIILGGGDKIRYGSNAVDIVSPSNELLQSAEPNDWSLVMKLKNREASVLLTGDISGKVEKTLVSQYNLQSNILKVSHHGSKFSSSANFLEAVKPQIAVIGVGKNSYGHPSKEALDRLTAIGAQIFRTDKDGTIKLEIAEGKINIFKKK